MPERKTEKSPRPQDAAMRELHRENEGAGLTAEFWNFTDPEMWGARRVTTRAGVEICINLEGTAKFVSSAERQTIPPGTIAIYRGKNASEVTRDAGSRHRFITIHVPSVWIRSQLPQAIHELAPTIRAFVDDTNRKTPRQLPISSPVRRAAEEMITSPIEGQLRPVWYHAKIIEVIAHVFTHPEDGFFCDRQKMLARERAEAVKGIVLRDLENPPSLGAIAREVGCSPSYLSRIFSEATGMTIMRFLRTARLDLASERLRSGKYNVTEAAVSVGYSSLSHFSKAFAEQFGHCPCVFPFQK